MGALIGLRRFAVIGTALLASLANSGQASAGEPSLASGKSLSFAPGELLIGYKTPADLDKSMGVLQASAKSFQLLQGGRPTSFEVEKLLPGVARLRVEVTAEGRALIQSSPEVELQVLEDLAAKLRASDPTIEFVHPNWKLPLEPQKFDSKDLPSKKQLEASRAEPGLPNDTLFRARYQWDYELAPRGMNAVGAWKVTKGDPSVVVAVVDTGLATQSPDLVAGEYVLEGWSIINAKITKGADEVECTDVNHGTHVAGTIGAARSNNSRGIAGISWKTTILPLRVFQCHGSALVGDIARAMAWAAGFDIEGWPRNLNKANIINLSLGGSFPCEATVLQAIIDHVRRAGTTVVVAAGNDSTDIANISPAGCKGVISVAAVNAAGRLASYSNFGNVTISAPGGENNQRDAEGRLLGVWSTIKPSGANPGGLASFSGTSMAAPHVSGAIALAMAKFPELRNNPDMVAAAIRATASPFIAGACPQDRLCGPGYLDAGALVRLKNLPPATSQAISGISGNTAQQPIPDGSSAANSQNQSSSPEATKHLPTEVLATTGVSDLGQDQTGLDGSWHSEQFGGIIEIEGNEWRHPGLGVADIQYDRAGRHLSLVYQSSRQACEYRANFANGRETLVLEGSQPTQSIDACPTGTFSRVSPLE